MSFVSTEEEAANMFETHTAGGKFPIFTPSERQGGVRISLEDMRTFVLNLFSLF